MSRVTRREFMAGLVVSVTAANLPATSVPVTVFSLSMSLIPVVGVFSGMLALGERPTWAEYASLALVLGSLERASPPVV